MAPRLRAGTVDLGTTTHPPTEPCLPFQSKGDTKNGPYLQRWA